MSPFLLIDLVEAVLAMLLAYFTIISKNGKTAQGKIFVALTISFLVWMIANHISNDTTVPYDIALGATRLIFPASFIVAILALNLITKIVGYKSTALEKGAWPLAAIATLIFVSPLTARDIYPDGEIYGVEFGLAGYLYGLTISGFVLAMIVIVVKNWNSPSVSKRKQIRAVGVGAMITAPSILILGYIIPNATDSFAISQIALAPGIVLVSALYYATIRHGLFDLRSAAIRTMTYILTLSVLTVIYFFLAYLLSVFLFHGRATNTGLSVSPLNVILALVMTVLFQPIKQAFDKLTNRIFYRGTYNQDEFLRNFSHIISFNTNLNVLLDRAGDFIADNLKSTAVSFYITDRNLTRSRGDSPLEISSATLEEIKGFSPKNSNELILTDNLPPSRFSKILQHQKIKILIPMRLNNKTIGYMLMGEHKTGGYTVRDRRIVESIINELAIAIQNSLSVEVIRDLNENLQTKVDDATQELRATNEQLKELDKTKDEFLSIASHQLRTPLTSIKGYVDMLREGDFGDVNQAQKDALDETFASSERMVRLINDFLNVSRLQTGKFTIEKTPTDLKKMVQGEVNMMQLVAKQSDIKFNVDTQDVGKLKVDAEKLKQVILNMIDNAIFYSQPNSTVHIGLREKDGFIEFTVKDTGLGVPKSEQAKLFGKFFRATNARKRRPDGTGVGLFLSKKVVTGHKGEMIFKSEEGKGSTFGFKLPL